MRAVVWQGVEVGKKTAGQVTFARIQAAAVRSGQRLEAASDGGFRGGSRRWAVLDGLGP